MLSMLCVLHVLIKQGTVDLAVGVQERCDFGRVACRSYTCVASRFLGREGVANSRLVAD